MKINKSLFKKREVLVLGVIFIIMIVMGHDPDIPYLE